MSRFNVFAIIWIAVCLAIACSAPPAFAAAIVDERGDVVLSADGPEGIPALVRLLGDDSAYIRGQAEDALAGMGEEALPQLHGALATAGDVRGILNAIYRINSPGSMQVMVGYVSDNDADIARVAKSYMQLQGAASVMPLLDGLKQGRVSLDAVTILARDMKPGEETLGKIRGMLSGGDVSMKRAAAELLGRWGDAQSEKGLIGLMKDKSPGVRLSAYRGYGLLHRSDRGAYDRALLLDGLDDPDRDVRYEAVSMLNFVADDTMTDRLLADLGRESDPEVKAAIVTALGATNDRRVVLVLLDMLTSADTDEAVMVDVIYVLGEMDATEAVPYITGLYSNGPVESVAIQKETFDALRKLGEPVDMKPFLYCMKHGDSHKVSTTELLVMMKELAVPGDSEVIEALEKFRAGETDAGRVSLVDAILEKIR